MQVHSRFSYQSIFDGAYPHRTVAFRSRLIGAVCTRIVSQRSRSLRPPSQAVRCRGCRFLCNYNGDSIFYPTQSPASSPPTVISAVRRSRPMAIAADPVQLPVLCIPAETALAVLSATLERQPAVRSASTLARQRAAKPVHTK